MKETDMDSRKRNFIIALLATGVLVVFDQLTKHLAATALANGPIVIWPGVFELYYHENNGAAFGLMQNMHVIFYLVTVVLSVGILWVLWRIPSGKRYHFLRICCVGILSGALGNFIDRVTQHYVVDFLYFSLIDFPIFNVADIYVTLSTILFFGVFIFYYKESDLEFLAHRKEKAE